MITLDVIIPVRTNDEYNIIDRIKYRQRVKIPNNVNIIVVDDGSKIEDANIIKGVCNKLGFKYIRINSEHEYMNLSKSRNIALLESKAEYVIFEDVDLFYSIDFYERILKMIEVYLETKKLDFLTVPVLYLSEEKSSYYYEEISNNSNEYELISNVIFGTNIQHYAPVSSVLVINRKYAINIGGFFEEYKGWGFEDSDFVLRLLLHTDVDKPRTFYKLDTISYDKQFKWQGWRALFYLFGNLMERHGIYMYHYWHPMPKHRNPKVRERNYKIFKQRTNYFFSKNYVPKPLYDKNNSTILHLSVNPHSYGLQQFHVLENSIYIDENSISISNIDNIIDRYKVSRIVFMNPYANTHRRDLYQYIKSKNYNFYVVERGALPGSIYFDDTGFCAESQRYSDVFWPKNFSQKDKSKILSYISDFKLSPDALEPQSDRIGGENLRNILLKNDTVYKKIIFVALQSASDTTTTYFAGDILTYDNFINEIKRLVKLLPDEYLLVIKNHPLSIQKIDIDGAVVIDNYNIYDILEATDYCILINSGVGVLSLIYEKPVFYFGKTFYSSKGLNKKVNSAEEIVDSLNDGFDFDIEKSLKFLYYLVFDFYSFATWNREERKHTDKAKMSISKNIKYKVIRLPDGKVKYFSEGLTDFKNSLLFDRFKAEDNYLNENSNKVEQKKEENDRVAKTYSKTNNKNSIIRKWYKLKNNPKSFFLDSRFFVFKFIGKIL